MVQGRVGLDITDSNQGAANGGCILVAVWGDGLTTCPRPCSVLSRPVKANAGLNGLFNSQKYHPEPSDAQLVETSEVQGGQNTPLNGVWAEA